MSVKRKPTNMLTLSKKPSLRRSAVLAEAEKIVKERKNRTKGTAEKAASKKTAKTDKKPAVKKTTAKKTAAKKGTVPKVRKDPMWKNLAKALKKEG